MKKGDKLKATRGIRSDMGYVNNILNYEVVREALRKDGYEPDEAVLMYLKSAKRELDTLIRKLTDELTEKHKEVKP